MTSWIYMTLLGAQLSHAAPVTTIDFEGVEVRGSTPRPMVQLIGETSRDICPQSDEITDPGWAECVVNLSYGDIKNLCSELGPSTPQLVVAMMNRKERHPGFDNDVISEEMRWRGCFYNSKTGPSVEDFVWRGTGNGWIVTNAPETYNRVIDSTQTSLSVFDGLEQSDHVTKRDAKLDLPATYAYALVRGRTGTWTAVPSTTNQDEINRLMEATGLSPVYCGSERRSPSEDLDCEVLPRLAVVALSPTMLAVKSYLPQRVGYLVTGIFWRSETGYDIVSEAGAQHPAP